MYNGLQLSLSNALEKWVIYTHPFVRNDWHISLGRQCILESRFLCAHSPNGAFKSNKIRSTVNFGPSDVFLKKKGSCEYTHTRAPLNTLCNKKLREYIHLRAIAWSSHLAKNINCNNGSCEHTHTTPKM